MKFDGRKLVGSLLTLVGLGFFAAAVAEQVANGWTLTK